MEEKNLIQKLANRLQNGNFDQVADEVLEEMWSNQFPIEDAKNMFDYKGKGKLLLSFLSRNYTNSVSDLANFIENSATASRLNKLRALTDKQSLLANINKRNPSKALDQLIEIINNSEIIKDNDSANGDDSTLYRSALVEYLNEKRHLIQSQEVDLIPTVLASVAHYSMEAGSNGKLNYSQVCEYDKAIRPLVYGLARNYCFTSNSRANRYNFIPETNLMNVLGQIYNCEKTENNDKLNAYFHNLSLYSLIKDVNPTKTKETTKDNSIYWNCTIDENATGFLTLGKNDYVLNRLSRKNVYPKFSSLYSREYANIFGNENSAFNNTDSQEKLTKVLTNVADAVANDDSFTDGDKNLIAMALVRPINGIAQQHAPENLGDAQKELNQTREELARSKVATVAATRRAEAAEKEAKSYKQMYNARVTREGKKEQTSLPRDKKTKETLGQTKTTERAAAKDEGLVFFEGHTSLTDRQRYKALKYITGKTPMVTKLGKIFGLRRSEVEKLNPREVISEQAIENLTGYLKVKGATKEEALHIAHYNALPVILWTPESTIKEVKKLNDANAVAQEKARETEFQKMVKPLTRLAIKINKSREQSSQATGAYWTETKAFADKNDHIRYNELIEALESKNPVEECKKLAPHASDDQIKSLLALRDAVAAYAPVSEEHQNNVVKNFVKARTCELYPDVEKAFNQCQESTKVFRTYLDNFANKYSLDKYSLYKSLYGTIGSDPYYGEIENVIADHNVEDNDVKDLLLYSAYQMEDLFAYSKAMEQHVDINKTLADVKAYIDGTEKVDALDMYDIICDNLSVERPVRKVATKQAVPADDKQTNNAAPAAETKTTEEAPKTSKPKVQKTPAQQLADLAKKRAKLTQQYITFLEENDFTAAQGNDVQDYVDTATTAGKAVRIQTVEDLLSISDETKMLYDLYNKTYHAWHDFVEVTQENGFSAKTSKLAEEICRHFYSYPTDNMPYHVGSKKVTADKIKGMRGAALNYIKMNESLVECINNLNCIPETKKEVKNLLLKNIETKKPVDIIKLQKLFSDLETF